MKLNPDLESNHIYGLIDEWVTRNFIRFRILRSEPELTCWVDFSNLVKIEAF